MLNLVDFYQINSEADCPALKNIQVFVDIFESKIDIIHDIIHCGNINKKEIPLLKIIFDILIHNSLSINKFNAKIFLEKIIPVAISFYSGLTNHDIKYMKDILNRNKITIEVLCKIVCNNSLDKKLNAIQSDKKSKYLRYLINLKNQYSLLFRGIEENKFFI